MGAGVSLSLSQDGVHGESRFSLLFSFISDPFPRVHDFYVGSVPFSREQVYYGSKCNLLEFRAVEADLVIDLPVDLKGDPLYLGSGDESLPLSLGSIYPVPTLCEGQKGVADAGSRPSGERDLKIGNDTDDTIFVDAVYADYGGAFSPFRYENSVQTKIQAVYSSSLLDFRAAFVADMAEPIEYRRQRRRRGPGDCYRLVLNMDLQIRTLALPYAKIYRIQILRSGCRQAFPCLGHGLDFLPFWLVWFM